MLIPDQPDAWHVKIGAPDASGVSPVELSCLLELPSSPVSIHAETSHFVDGIESYGISKVSGTAGVSTYTQTGGSRKYHLRLRGRILSSDMDRATLKALSLKLENGTEIRKTLGNEGLKVQDIPRTAPAKEGTGGGCNSPSLGGSCLALVSLLRRIRSRMSHSANRS
ncbi:MAG: hypothetical protein Q4A13_10945 [Fretibacterium sp.]|nr:hypothetical protein [Fretibacterium sp.]